MGCSEFFQIHSDPDIIYAEIAYDLAPHVTRIGPVLSVTDLLRA